MAKKKYFSIVLIANAIISPILLILVFCSFGSKSNFKTLQAEQLRIISKNSNEEIHLGFSGSAPSISIVNENKEATFTISGGEEPALTIFDAGVPVFIVSSFKGKGAEIVLNDNKAAPKVHISSSDISGVFLKNDANKTVGSFTVINNGGGGFGLADSNGTAAALLRGGDNPSLAFFSEQEQPLAALGVMQKTPHMVISGPLGEEGILIHGGKPNSLLVVDEKGKVKILISKHGVFQGKDENEMGLKKKDKRIFSLDDQNRLFPSLENKKR